MVDTKYNHIEIEKDKYEYWLKKELFKSGNLNKEPFSIVIPPPNVTGKLHLGHAWDTSLQDIIIRYKKLQGFDTLWVPGMDHAGVATQAKIDERLRLNNINPRSLKREEWLEYAWSWKEEYAKIIREQWKKLGLSLDYSKERFTLDDKLNQAVNKVFIDLYNNGLIYRGDRIINFDPVAMTALSNIEVVYKEVEGSFYHIKYMIEDSNEYLEVATTRPETLFGDTAVAVNPKDERYKNLIGKNVILPIVNKKIPIIGDDYADINFGTGVVKITPAHDPNDFEVGIRHNLERILCINLNGTMNGNALHFKGLDRFECRKKLIEELKANNLFIKEEKMKHNVGFSERTNTMVEPILSLQWFIKMEPLAKEVLKIQKLNDEKVNFIPKRFEKILINWMTTIQDWCISRQVWWGHRIPAYYKDNDIYVGLNPPKDYVQDNDVLDTWFSSALWPFSTMGWPNEMDSRYFPNSMLVTGYDIIFFWVSRMIFTSLEFNKQIPFKEVLIHGLIRDKDGRKMSKSLGNGVDPMDVIEKYGADSLRYFLATNTAPGMDLRYDEEKVKSAWNYINKIYNASRYVIMNEDESISELSISDKWILHKMNDTIKDVTKNMEKYQFQNVANILYTFIWNDFCDWYIEFSKINKNYNILKLVLNNILKMLHPFMPFVTEELYQKLNKTESSIMESNYPKYNKEYIYKQEYKEIEELRPFITEVRNSKVENDIKKDAFVKLEVNNSDIESLLIGILKLNDYSKEKVGNKEVKIEKEDIKITFYIKQNIENKEQLNKEIEILKYSIARRKKILSNENYISKAPEHLILEEREKLELEEKRLEKIK